MASPSHLRLERRGPLAVAVLDRPGALNALDLGMIRDLAAAAADWAQDPSVRAVVLKGAGPRAFCAGGDIRGVCTARDCGNASATQDFFAEEYRLNRAIHRFPKPWVPLMDGITMGGGVGLSIYGSHRVVTERTRWAMSETGIGFFPDVGGGWFLPRLPGALGRYLALTGATLGPADVLAAGIATHFVPSQRLEALEAALAGASWEGDDDPGEIVTRVLDFHAADPGPAPLDALRPAIDACFGAASPEATLAALARLATPWARETLEALAAKSPTSVRVTCRLLDEGGARSLEEDLVVEYRLSQRFVASHDFCEGVRAALVDRDHRPRWDPPRLAGVTDEEVAAFFAPLGDRELRFADAPLP
ncbi:MAG: enoyl-CoA hydratase/isomerase family protein [Thermodesulfobacteriota bacterium]